MSIVLDSHIALGVKSSMCPMDELGLLLRANGEQEVSLIDRAGNIFKAEIPTPTAAPTYVTQAVVATGLAQGYYRYVYVYAATDRYPLVDAGIAINGSIAPRGNPSASTAVQAVNAGTTNRITLSIPCHERKDISEIWIFRTDMLATAALALVDADAGLLFYVGSIANDPTGVNVTYLDSLTSVTLDKVELDNFPAPQFAHAVYEAPYCWGFGNDAFIANVQWSGTEVIITDTNLNWFSGRNGQIATVTGITSGGFDGRGNFYFLYSGPTQGYLTADGSTPVTLSPTTGTGVIKIQGFSTTLYRSKANNPFSWGETITFGSNQVAQTFAKRVGGGQGTAIAVLPGGEALKLDCKNPNACYIYNLRLASFPEFAASRRKISNLSVSAHHSQFVASTREGGKVLWGFDADNLAILQCDGQAQYPVSQTIQDTLRFVDPNPDRIRFAHGIYDSVHRLNVMWLPVYGKSNFTDPNSYVGTAAPTYDSIKYWTDLAIIQHPQTGKWTTSCDFDLTASAAIRDNYADVVRTIAGTDRGLVGKIFFEANDPQPEWASGDNTARSVSLSSFTLSNFSSVTDAVFSAGGTSASLKENLLGCWVAIVNPTTQQRLFLRVTDAAEDGGGIATLTFDYCLYDLAELYTNNTSTADDTVLYIREASSFDPTSFPLDSIATCSMYVGIAPATMLKYIQVANDIVGLKRIDYVRLITSFSIPGYSESYCLASKEDQAALFSFDRVQPISYDDSTDLGLPACYAVYLKFHLYWFASLNVPRLKQILIKIAE